MEIGLKFMWKWHLILLCGGCLWLPDGLSADKPRVDFESEIAPLFARHCVSCHGTEKRQGGLRLTNRRDAFIPSDSGEPVLIPGDPEGSILWERISSPDESLRMPPEGPPLTAIELEKVRRWIQTGAHWTKSPTEESHHWAYVKPVRPPLPEVKLAEWPRTPVDHFLLAQMEKREFTPAPAMDKARWLRRVSLGLIGLPPTVAELDRFLADNSPQAEQQVVDRLLNSPRFGEHWARLWLDLARYADTNGYQADQYRESWAYRDWVIQALNDDMPFDQFVLEQLAGDLLPDATVEQRIATGFHRTVTCNLEAGVHPEENRVNQVFDRVNTTGTVFLGTTLECAQCHNHKYDPFSQQEYYELFAYFNNTPLEVGNNSGVQFNFIGPHMELPVPPAQQTEREKLQTLQQQLRQQRISELETAVSHWESRVAAGSFSSEPWQPLTIREVTGTAGELFQLRPDHSVLVEGNVPEGKTIYTVLLDGLPAHATALKIECLTDPALPGKGPGRGDPQRNNFILSEFQASIGSEPVSFSAARADFSQQNWDVAGAIDGDPKSGWAIAPAFGKPHWALFVLETPLVNKTDAPLIVQLQQNYGQGRTIGCFRISATTETPALLSLPAEIHAVLTKQQRSAAERRQLDQWLVGQESALRKLDAELARIEQELAELQPPTTLVMVEMQEPRETRVMIRGDYLNMGNPVTPATPAMLHPLDPAEPRNRLGLARWLVDRENPLIARVTVNRWWAELWGTGIVATLEDFGLQSEPPTHPELLDWLAVEFMDNGWSMKHLLKQIVLSSAYRQSSHVTTALYEVDPLNKWLARGPRFRMSAEMIRDNGLRISGLLSDQRGGPPVMPYQPDGLWNTVGRNSPVWKAAENESRFRRGVYVYWRRAAPYPSFVNFDAPDRAACVAQRSRTNTPTQALTLLNDPAWLEMAAGLALQLFNEHPQLSDTERVRHAFRRTLAREPVTDEIHILLSLLSEERDRLRQDQQSARALLENLKRLRELLHLPDEELPDPVEWATWLHLANVLLNLDETITRN